MWTRLTQVEVANGSRVIKSPQIKNEVVLAGDAISITHSGGDTDWLEIESVREGELTLVRTWGLPTATGLTARVIPLVADFNRAVESLDEATQTTQDNFGKLEDWLTQENGTVTFTRYDGTTITIRSLKQIENDALSATRTSSTLFASTTPQANVNLSQPASNFKTLRITLGIIDATQTVSDIDASVIQVVDITSSQLTDSTYARFIKLFEHITEDDLLARISINTQSSTDTILRTKVETQGISHVGVVKVEGIGY